PPTAATPPTAAAPPTARGLTHLAALEAESIHMIREVAAEFERPALMFSGGKDSIVLAHLARKAFAPGRVPFPLLHIDTGHNFPETLTFRDRFVRELPAQLIVRSVEDSIRSGRVEEKPGSPSGRNPLQSVTLLDAIREFQFDAALGGARRDEEKARAKERCFSLRDRFGAWEPRNQRPELWNLYNSRRDPGEHFRVFPLSNWTETDIWVYLRREALPLPSLYFSHLRPCVRRGPLVLAHSEYLTPQPGDHLETLNVRFRTVGDMTCTGAVRSEANSLEEIILELGATRASERGARADDQRSESSMEDRKREGYF
ncbi:MAG: sulfate adenylyltransferase subunit CysD, partial [Acidobacteria bacterium]|nr:sulfate adenylyltransferase subunit CysD [Acidobacteriota bacterium]